MPGLNKGLLGSSDSGFDWTDADPGTGSSPARAPAGKGAAADGRGSVESASHGQSGGSSTSTAAAGTALAATLVTTAGSGLAINLQWDSSVTTATPAGFAADLIAVAHFLESQITTAATINLQVGYGTILGQSLSAGALGESSTNIRQVSSASLLAALNATSSGDATDVGVLASLRVNPVSGTYYVTTAQAKALGISGASGSVDGAIGFGTSSAFTYGDTNTGGPVASGSYDFFGTALHEITEVMGRQMFVGIDLGGRSDYTLMDLLHYNASGARVLTQTAGGISVNGGVSLIGALNANSGGDSGDWASSVANDPLDAFATPGKVEIFSATDSMLMDALGWNLTGSAVAPPSPPSVTNQTAAQTWTEGQRISLTLASNTFTDPRGQALSYAAVLSNGQALPSWLTFNGATDSFSGTAPTTTASLTIKVTATDTSGLSASETFAASVVAPPPPPPPSPPTVAHQTAGQTWIEGQAVTLALPANTFVDPQGQKLTYTASQSNGTALPSWLSFNAASETFSGTAPATTSSLSLKVTATDTSGLSASETFAASVVAPATKPGIAVTNQTAAQTWIDGSTLNFALPSNTFTDALGLKMTFAAYQVSGSNVASWLRFNPSTDTFSGKVPANLTGTIRLEVIATDSKHVTATDLFNVTFAPATTSQSGSMIAPSSSVGDMAIFHTSVIAPVGLRS